KLVLTREQRRSIYEPGLTVCHYRTLAQPWAQNPSFQHEFLPGRATLPKHFSKYFPSSQSLAIPIAPFRHHRLLPSIQECLQVTDKQLLNPKLASFCSSTQVWVTMANKGLAEDQCLWLR